MHTIQTTALSSDRPRVNAELAAIFTKDAFRVVAPIDGGDRTGCKVLVFGNGAALRDIAGFLDRAGWLA